MLKCPFDLWKSFICDDLIEQMLEQTLLYGRQDNNNISFDLNYCVFWHYLFVRLSQCSI